MERDQVHLLSDIRYIREVMELSAEHRVLPDWAAILGGALAFGAALFTRRLAGSWDAREVLFLPPDQKLQVTAVWAAVAVLSVAAYWALATRESRRLGVSLKARPTQLARQAMGPSVLAALVLTLSLIGERRYGLIPGVWMLMYGIGLYNAGLFSTEEPRLLGTLFIVTGIATILLLPAHGLALAAAGFGGYHAAFGAYVLWRSRGR